MSLKKESETGERRACEARALRARKTLTPRFTDFFTDFEKKTDCFAVYLTFGGRCNRYFWDIQLKSLSLPNFNMLFQLVLTKFFKSELFSCLPKVDHVIKSCKEPIVKSTLLQEVAIGLVNSVLKQR